MFGKVVGHKATDALIDAVQQPFLCNPNTTSGSMFIRWHTIYGMPTGKQKVAGQPELFFYGEMVDSFTPCLRM